MLSSRSDDAAPGKPLVAFLLFLLFAGQAHGATWTGDGAVDVELVPEAMQITFAVGALFHTVQGTAALQEGHLRFTPASGLLQGNASIRAASMTTGNHRRDRRMQQDVLESSAHPLIMLHGQRADGVLDPDSGGDLQIEALLEILGRKHPVSFPLEISILNAETGRIRISGSLKIPYVAWGLRDPSAIFLRVEKEVEVSFAGEGLLRPVLQPRHEP